MTAADGGSSQIHATEGSVLARAPGRLMHIGWVLLLVTTACAAGPPADVTGVWVLESVEIDGRETAIRPGANTATTPWIEIGETLTGNYGCNAFAGSFSFDGGSIVPDGIFGEEARCPGPAGAEGLMYAEDQLRPLLESNLPIVVRTGDDRMTWASIGRLLEFSRTASPPDP